MERFFKQLQHYRQGLLAGNVVVVYLLLFSFYVFVLPETSYAGDMKFWKDWAIYIHQHGFSNIYLSDTNYHPLFLYFLYLFQEFQGSVENIEKYLNYVKVFPLVFDFLGALTVWYVIPFKNKAENYFIPFLLLFSIAYMYNTMLWGQLDSVHTFFIVAALISGVRGKTTFSILCFILAINMKLHAIIFVPLLGLIWLLSVFNKKNGLKKTIRAVFFGAAAQLLTILPFIYSGTLDRLLDVVFGASSKYPSISLNAFNFWYLYFYPRYDLTAISDSLFVVGGLTYKGTGITLFFAGSLIILLPLLKFTFKTIREKIPFHSISTHHFFKLVFLTAGLITLTFFYFNTQMHERYSHPALLLLFLFSYLDKNYLMYILVSLAYLLNMERVLQAFELNSYGTIIFNPVFISGFYGVILILGIGILYRKYSSDYQSV